jgi:lipopolysaccharide transport system permease protein
MVFVRRDLVAAYKQTVMGPLWMLLQPILTTLVFSLIFGRIANLPTGGAPRLLFYMPAYIPWIYFSESLNRTSSTFIGNAAIFGKVYFPRLITPVSVVVANMMKFFIQMVVFTALYFIYVFWLGAEVRPNWHVFLLPIPIILIAVLSLSCGLVISSLTTKYRDLSFLVTYAMQLLMYGSSIIFSITSPAKTMQGLRPYLQWNPLVWIHESFRYALIGVGEWSWLGLGYCAAITMFMLFIAVVVFSRVERTFMDTV